MLVSYNWLNKYFDNKLPAPEAVAEAFTFHAWEIESVEKVGDDSVLDIKVLPDKAMWALSHRGIAKDLSVILDIPLALDQLASEAEAFSVSAGTPVNIETNACRRFAAARIEGVKVGSSPEWLRLALEAIGQRSINNIVDASNYVMFDLGQPSHAFDAALVGTNGFKVRQANVGEKLTGLDEKEYTFTADDTVIAKGDNDEILSIAGLKGGKHSGINEQTTSVIVEVANWDPIAVRKTGQRLKLRTDASSRYENGIVPNMVPYGLKAVTDLIVEVAGGQVVDHTDTEGSTLANKAVAVDLNKINRVLGVSLSLAIVSGIIDRFGWKYQVDGETFTITPPFERTDLVIPEDVIEEIGRVHGYLHVTAVTPEIVPLAEINQRFYYSELIRGLLIDLGFSEIYTSSFRESDEVKLSNAFAADKGYLRSNLKANMAEALLKNAPNADLLGIRQVKLFEIGTVFTATGEKLLLSLGVSSPSGYKAKSDDPALKAAIEALNTNLGTVIDTKSEQGIAEIDLEAIIVSQPKVYAYEKYEKPAEMTYKSFSLYPSVSRDIAMWVPAGTAEEEVMNVLKERAGDLCVRVSLFDQFEKEGRVSYAFRLVFQSKEKTLEGSEVETVMDDIYQALRERQYEVR